jgi:hypothetical protein
LGRFVLQLAAMNTGRKASMNILCWILIALLAAATLRWIAWGSHQRTSDYLVAFD